MNTVICIAKRFTRQNIMPKRIRFSMVLAFLISATIIVGAVCLVLEMMSIPEIRIRYDDK